MRKRVILLVVMLCMVIGVVNHFEVEGNDTKRKMSDKEKRKCEKLMTEHLVERISSDENEELSVTIQIEDNVDLEKIEQLALKKNNITSEELLLLEEKAYDLSDQDNIEYQKKLMELYDGIRAERNKLLKEHYTELNKDFLKEVGWGSDQYDSVSKYTPFIRGVNLSTEEIYKLAERQDIKMIDVADNRSLIKDYSGISDIVSIIGGDVAISNGYTGEGVRVALVESGHPLLSVMGTDATGITNVNYGPCYPHATMTGGIIKRFAPDCKIYSYCAGSAEAVVDACIEAIDKYNVQVINLSCGIQGNGSYNSTTCEFDVLVHNYKVTIIASAGNNSTYISKYAFAPNVIAVGAVKSIGTNPTASHAYTVWSKSSFVDNYGKINKPDICAPGCVTIYSYTDEGTSYAAPVVTGTVVQMISRNAGLGDKPTIIKAAIMASGVYNAGTSRDYIPGTIVSNKEGAGVINSEFCYYVARNGRRTHFDIKSTDTSYTYNVYCDTVTKPFRIACAWEVIPDKSKITMYCNDYDISVYKNGKKVATSTARYNEKTGHNTNYEIIELSPTELGGLGAGYYQVKIEKIITNTLETVRVGLAWEQP